MTNVGIVGAGGSGKAFADAFRSAGALVSDYDPELARGRPEDLASCDAVFICVSSPCNRTSGFDLGPVWSLIEEIEPYLGSGSVVALRGTVPPGTCEAFASAFADLIIASVPELESPEHTFENPDRMVIGTRSPEAATLLTQLLSMLAPGGLVLVVQPTEAELIRLCSNILVASKAILAGQLADVCYHFGVDWARIQAGIGLDRRIGSDRLNPPGNGGEFEQSEVDGLIGTARATGYTPTLLEAIAGFGRQFPGRDRSETGTKRGLVQRSSMQ